MIKTFFINDLPRETTEIEIVEGLFEKKLVYASKGRFGIYHILKSLKNDGIYDGKSVMVPVYACSSIPWAVKKAGFQVDFYDICSDDLNGNIESIKEIHKRTQSKILIIPSLYGNPADLIRIEKFCKKNGIFMIDDAAQAFGSSIADRKVGSFGNAGLFSFSAGKPTYGHMGGFYWSDSKSEVLLKKRHILYHIIEYVNFYYNRFSDYNSKRLYRCYLLDYFKIFLYKVIDISEDDCFNFEKKILKKIIHANLDEWDKERVRVISILENRLNSSTLRIVTSKRGKANNNKIIVIASSESERNELMRYLKHNNCYCSKGYKLLDDNMEYYPVANEIFNKVVEIPITAHTQRNNDFIKVIMKWVEENSEVATS